MMAVNTRIFGYMEIEDEKIITFPAGIIGFPEMTQFALIHDEDKGVGGIHWLQSLQEPAFAMPVMDPLTIKEDYNPEVDDEILKPLGDLNPDETLVMVTVTVPSDLTKMTVNLRGPIIINALTKKAAQVIIEDNSYQVRYPIYEILKARKGGE